MESTEIKNPPLHEGTFEYAVNGFYYMNPPYPLWIFGVFYLAKKHLLAVINNYDLTHENILICVFRHQVDGKEKSKICNEARAACDKIIDNTSKLLQAVNNEVTNNNLK